MFLEVESGSARVLLRFASDDNVGSCRVRQVPLVARASVLWVF